MNLISFYSNNNLPFALKITLLKQIDESVFITRIFWKIALFLKTSISFLLSVKWRLKKKNTCKTFVMLNDHICEELTTGRA